MVILLRRRAALLVLLLTLVVAMNTAQAASSEVLFDDDGDELVNIVVNLKDANSLKTMTMDYSNVDITTTSTNAYIKAAKSSSSYITAASSSSININQTPVISIEQAVRNKFNGAIVTTQLKRAHAVGMRIRKSELEALENDPNVVSIEPDNLVYPMNYDLPMAGEEPDEEASWGFEQVDLESATIPAASDPACFKICVVDGGVLLSHPDIPWEAGSVHVTGKTFNLPQGQTWDRPIYNHGTHVTGIMVAEANNHIGIKGVIGDSSNICMLVARVFDDAGSGQQDSFILDAVEWCADKGARVINLSLGSESTGTAARAVYDKVYSEGVLMFGAAGNTGNSNYNYPASFDSVISVAAVDSTLGKATFSTYNDKVDMAAPGVSIRSTVPQSRVVDGEGTRYVMEVMEFSVRFNAPVTANIFDCGEGIMDGACNGASGKICVIKRGGNNFATKARICAESGGIGVIVYNNVGGMFTGTLLTEGSVLIPVVGISQDDGKSLLVGSTTKAVSISMTDPGYTEISGTSMATPFASGIAARIWSARPLCTNDQVREALFTSAKSLGTSNTDQNNFGSGLVQAQAAYDELLKMPLPCGEAINSGVPTNGVPNNAVPSSGMPSSGWWEMPSSGSWWGNRRYLRGSIVEQ